MPAKQPLLPLTFHTLRWPQETLTAIVDSRERNPLDLGELAVEVAELRTGDYTLKGYEDLVALERKGFHDLVYSCGPESDRFESQIQRLLSFPIRALVVEAHWDDFNKKTWIYADVVSQEHIRETLLRIQASGLPVIMAGTHQRAGRIVAEFLKFVWDEYHPSESLIIKIALPEAA